MTHPPTSYPPTVPADASRGDHAGSARRPRRMTLRGRLFLGWMTALGSVYLLIVLALLISNLDYLNWASVRQALASEDIRYAFKLTFISSMATVTLALLVAVPAGYLLSRYRFPGVLIVDTILDIPIVLPPLVVGVALLVAFSTPAGRWVNDNAGPVLKVLDTAMDAIQWLLMIVTRGLAVVLEAVGWASAGRAVSYQPINMGHRGFTHAQWGVVLAQFVVAAAFGIRMIKASFEQVDPRLESVARTLGASRGWAFWRVTLPAARSGVLAAAVVTWARAVGEFGPILIFCGAARKRTEVLPTSIWLEFSNGQIHAALAISIMMVAMAMVTLLIFKKIGGRV